MSLSARERRILSELERDLAAPDRMPFGADFRWVATMITGLIVGIATLSAGLVLGMPSIAVVGAALTQLGPAAGVAAADARRRAAG